MITFVSVTKEYIVNGQAVVAPVNGVSLELKRGAFVLIVGRSGSGKTTLLNLAAGLVKPTRGKVLVDGVELQKMSDEWLSSFRSRKMGFVFQFPSLLPALTVQENVAMPTIFVPKAARADAYERAAQVLSTLGLKEKLKAHPRQLSAGEQKRVVIARALINSPTMLLADEPTSDLDEQTEREVMALFREIHEHGMTIVMVTHSMELIPYATRAFLMDNGAVTDVTGMKNPLAAKAAVYQ